MQYELIPAVPSDRDWLEELRRNVYQDLFKATWGGWDEARHNRHFAECMALGHISIIVVAGDRVGMVQVFDTPDAIDVGEIQVHPLHQNRGLGSKVLTDIIAEAHKHRKPVRLSVGLMNHRAFRLYERLGFRQVARSDTHNHMEYEP